MDLFKIGIKKKIAAILVALITFSVFATYNNSKIIRYDVNDDKINIILKKREYFLYMESKYNDGLKLVAPVKGKMNKNIKESISAVIKIELRKDDKIIYSGTSKNCGFEIVR